MLLQHRVASYSTGREVGGNRTWVIMKELVTGVVKFAVEIIVRIIEV